MLNFQEQVKKFLYDLKRISAHKDIVEFWEKAAKGDKTFVQPFHLVGIKEVSSLVYPVIEIPHSGVFFTTLITRLDTNFEIHDPWNIQRIYPIEVRKIDWILYPPDLVIDMEDENADERALDIWRGKR